MSDSTTKHHERDLYVQSLKKKGQDQRKARLERKKAGIHLKPKTIESTRVYDNPRVDAENLEIQEEFDNDEFTALNELAIPKILITACDRPSPRCHGFCKELIKVIPNSDFVYRRKVTVKNLLDQAIENNFSSVIIINEDSHNINGMKIYTLPNGPTAYFRLSNVKLKSELKSTKHTSEAEQINPQVDTAKFSTMLGLRVSRLLLNLFPKADAEAAEEHNRCVCFVNSRDYIFFRHRRFKKKDDVEKLNSCEIGPRFTMRLRYLHKGLLTTKSAAYEYMYDKKVNTKCRRQFVL